MPDGSQTVASNLIFLIVPSKVFDHIKQIWTLKNAFYNTITVLEFTNKISVKGLSHILYFRHPDKNEDPSAESRFVEIKQAYELLSDTERRQAYDLYGITNEDDHMYKPRHDYSQYARFRFAIRFFF